MKVGKLHKRSKVHRRLESSTPGSLRQISRRKVGGAPRSRCPGSPHHDRLKGKSHRDIGSNPIHDYSEMKSKKHYEQIAKADKNFYPFRPLASPFFSSEFNNRLLVPRPQAPDGPHFAVLLWRGGPIGCFSAYVPRFTTILSNSTN